MKVKYGNGPTEYGPGVLIKLTGEDVAKAIYTYLTAKDVHIDGPATIRVNGDLCQYGEVYVDPSGYVVAKGKGYSGRGEDSKYDCRYAEDKDKERVIENILNLSVDGMRNGHFNDLIELKEQAKEVLNKKSRKRSLDISK